MQRTCDPAFLILLAQEHHQESDWPAVIRLGYYKMWASGSSSPSNIFFPPSYAGTVCLLKHLRSDKHQWFLVATSGRGSTVKWALRTMTCACLSSTQDIGVSQCNRCNRRKYLRVQTNILHPAGLRWERGSSSRMRVPSNVKRSCTVRLVALVIPPAQKLPCERNSWRSLYGVHDVVGTYVLVSRTHSASTKTLLSSGCRSKNAS